MIIGDDLSGYTFAMAYTRFGWSGVSMLCVILFIEPHRGRDPSLTGLAAGSVLTFGLCYLKITYFGVAVAAICLVLLTAPHIRRHWLPWCAVLLLVTLVALAPINDGYRGDIITAIGSRRINWTPRAVAAKLLNNGVEQSWVLVEILVLLYLVSERRAAFSDVLSGLFIAIFGFFCYLRTPRRELYHYTRSWHCCFTCGLEIGSDRPPTAP